MSSSVPKSSEGSKPPPPAVSSAAADLDSQQKNALNAAIAAIPSTVAVSQSPLTPSKQAPPERTADRRSNKVRRHHRKQSKAQSPAQRGISSVSSFSQAVTPAYILGIGTPQATTPDVWVSMAATPLSSQNGARSPAASTVRDNLNTPTPAQSKDASAADPSRAPADARLVSSASPNAPKAAASTSPTRRRSVKHHVHSAAPDFLKALASLAPSPEEEAARKGSVKGSKSLMGVGEELPTSLDRTHGSYAPPRFKLSFEAKLALSVLLVLTTLAFGFLLYRSAKQQTMVYCKTKCCEEHRYRIAKQLVKGVDPCNNFGDYVCGRWLPRKEYHLSRSQMSDMLLSWLYNFPNRLNKGYARFPIAKKVVAMFNMCLRTSGSQIEIMKEFMRARGIFWPEEAPGQVRPAKALFDLSLNWNVHLWSTLKIFPSVSKEKPRHIFLAPNELMLLWKAMFSQIPQETFQRVYKELFKIFSNDTSSEPNAESIWETYRMLERVFNTLVPACPCPARNPQMFSFRDIDSHTALPIGSHMKDMLNAVTAIDPPITMDDLVLVGDMPQLRKTLGIFVSSSEEAVLRHLSWLFVQAYGPVAYPMAVLLVTHGSEHRARKELPRFCAGQVESSYKLLLAAMTSVSFFSEEERRRISDHLAAIVQEAADKTWAVSWLDNDTKKVAVEKLKNVRTVLWPSDKFLTREALKEAYENFTYSASSFAEYWIETRRSQRGMYGSEAGEEELLLGDSTQLPYADYEQMLNRLSISLGALAPPLFCKDGTNAMLYGGLLYFYARMLITAIDRAGVKFNAQGEFVSSWLSDSTKDTYEQRTLHCLPGNTSIFPEVPAMEVAYAAFKRHHKANNIRLSEELTEEKVFFITACLATCATTPADNLYGGDCNKAVMNFAPFAEAFSCPVGSKMNPASKCTFYD